MKRQSWKLEDAEKRKWREVGTSEQPKEIDSMHFVSWIHPNWPQGPFSLPSLWDCPPEGADYLN